MCNYYRPRMKCEGRLCFDARLSVHPSICLSVLTWGGGGYLSQVQVGEGVPHLGYPPPHWTWPGGTPAKGVPHLRYSPHHRTWPGVPLLGGTPPQVSPSSQTWLGGTPARGIPHLGYSPPPPSDLVVGGGGVPHLG